jgi:hypothetical protein
MAKISLLGVGCENWFPKGRLKMFQNGLLARTFGPKEESITGTREVRREELQALFTSA